MCGIFGFLSQADSKISPKEFHGSLNRLFLFSESRGQEASGIAMRFKDSMEVVKYPCAARRMIRTQEYKDLFLNLRPGTPLMAIGHSRLVTDGHQDVFQNNQPVVKEGIVGIHNGIVVNVNEVWKIIKGMQRQWDVDTEAILGLVRYFLDINVPLPEALVKTFGILEGNASIALLFAEYQCLALATNNGSIYYCRDQKNKIFIFASERYIVRRLIHVGPLKTLIVEDDIEQLKAQTAVILDLNNLGFSSFSLKAIGEVPRGITAESKPIAINFSAENASPSPFKGRGPNKDLFYIPDDILSQFRQCEGRINSLKRCQRCVLPETMPFIEFDEQGICNFCRYDRGFSLKGEPRLKEILSLYKKGQDDLDCIVSISGGRDSCYALHYLKVVLKMNPMAYTYDWGMVTDLARRNIARICGKLGVEHVIVSADIQQKRRNIRKNVEAWLKRPRLGTVPLFMAGDKQYFYFAHKLKQQNGINLLIMAENLFEQTNFKTGFCGVGSAQSSLAYSLSQKDQMKLILYYLREFLSNPAYVNSSLMDSFWAFLAYYALPHDYISLYEYIPWKEKDVVDTLLKEYNWETAGDTRTTWRIGDGTAPFYNYIYYVVSGLTEHDTFRSHQIRQGHVSRDEALGLLQEDNKPRYHSIKWYCDTIGIDCEDTLRTIHLIPKFYEM